MYQLINVSINQCTNQSMYQSINVHQSINGSINVLINQFINHSMYQSINVHQSINVLINEPIS